MTDVQGSKRFKIPSRGVVTPLPVRTALGDPRPLAARPSCKRTPTKIGQVELVAIPDFNRAVQGFKHSLRNQLRVDFLHLVGRVRDVDLTDKRRSGECDFSTPGGAIGVSNDLKCIPYVDPDRRWSSVQSHNTLLTFGGD